MDGKKVRNWVMVFFFFWGLFFLAGVAGSIDLAVKEASVGKLICGGLLGIFMMMPLTIFLALGGRIDADDDKV